jgi:hypothetical protein
MMLKNIAQVKISNRMPRLRKRNQIGLGVVIELLPPGAVRIQWEATVESQLRIRNRSPVPNNRPRFTRA